MGDIAAVTYVIKRLSELVEMHADFIRDSAVEQLKQLEHELGLLKDFVEQAAALKVEEEQPVLIEMERQMREVIYDAEDTTDSCWTQVVAAAAECTKNPNRLFFWRRVKRLGLAEVNSLREDRVKPMLEKANMEFTAVTGDGYDLIVQQPRTQLQKVPAFRPYQFVGFKDEVRQIMSYLMEQKDELDAISIVGMPGQGKTTLAWEIYQNTHTKRAFPIRIWVHISPVLNMRDVCVNILKEFTDDEIMFGLSDHDLALAVGSFLKHTQFLLVLDNVCNVETWDSIKDFLPSSNGMGKVLITSRCMNVGSYASRTREPHSMRLLTESECWQLLQLEIFGVLDACPYVELTRIGESIARHCWRLPLGMVKIGAILCDQLSTTRLMNVIVNEWTKVYKDNLNVYPTSAQQDTTNEITLPNDMRDCFVYLGVFPEDYEISTWTLTRLWIAEGFVQPKLGQSLEETADNNLTHLIERKLVSVCKTNIIGQVKSIRVHPAMRAYCISRASMKEQNMFEVIKVEGAFYPPVFEIQNCRRLSIHSNIHNFLSAELDGTRVRSFLCFARQRIHLDRDEYNPIYTSILSKAFRLLRVLHPMSITFHDFPQTLLKLTHLRYLTLSSNKCYVLPEALSELWNLQTLVVDTKSRNLFMKANLQRMIQLRHLKTKAAIVLSFDKEEGNCGENENLQTVSRLSPGYCMREVLSRARNLKKLGIRGELASLWGDYKILGNLSCLEKLTLENVPDFRLPSELPLLANLQLINNPANLKSLTLSATYLDWASMPTLEKIQSLEVLKLKNMAFKGMSWKALGDGFPRLKSLLIQGTDLVEWNASSESFPCLRSLVIRNCRKLEEIPISLAKSLEVLEIDHVRKSAVESAQKIEQVKKQMNQEHDSGEGQNFKLVIGPGCHI